MQLLEETILAARPDLARDIQSQRQQLLAELEHARIFNPSLYAFILITIVALCLSSLLFGFEVEAQDSTATFTPAGSPTVAATAIPTSTASMPTATQIIPTIEPTSAVISWQVLWQHGIGKWEEDLELWNPEFPEGIGGKDGGSFTMSELINILTNYASNQSNYPELCEPALQGTEVCNYPVFLTNLLSQVKGDTDEAGWRTIAGRWSDHLNRFTDSVPAHERLDINASIAKLQPGFYHAYGSVIRQDLVTPLTVSQMIEVAIDSGDDVLVLPIPYSSLNGITVSPVGLEVIRVEGRWVFTGKVYSARIREFPTPTPYPTAVPTQPPQQQQVQATAIPSNNGSRSNGRDRDNQPTGPGGNDIDGVDDEIPGPDGNDITGVDDTEAPSGGPTGNNIPGVDDDGD